MFENQITRKNEAEIAKEEEAWYENLKIMPNEFDPYDPKRIQIFCKRMKEIRMLRNKENKAEGSRYLAYRQKDLADYLGVSSNTVSKYEGNEKSKKKSQTSRMIKSIPLHRFVGICSFYNATPHYLAGYVDDPKASLSLDNNRNIEQDKDGVPRILTVPVDFDPAQKISYLVRYQRLAYLNPDLYLLINKILVSNENKQKLCKEVLESIFKYT